MPFIKWIILSLIMLAFSSNSYANSNDSAIKKILIQKSLQKYSGRCPCPYSTDKAGNPCGEKSLHSTPSGHEPLCYESDVSSAAVKRHKQFNKINKLLRRRLN